MGYKDRTVLLSFEELGDGCFVRIKNPKLQPLDKLTAREPEKDADGTYNRDDATLATDELIASLILDWKVWDPSDEADEPAVLELPATSSTVALLPMQIRIAISEEMTSAFPS